MNCVHGVRIDKPCPDCEYEADCRARKVEPQNRWMPPANPFDYKTPYIKRYGENDGK